MYFIQFVNVTVVFIYDYNNRCVGLNVSRCINAGRFFFFVESSDSVNGKQNEMGQTEEEEEEATEQRNRNGRPGLCQCGKCDRRGHAVADVSNVVRQPQWKTAVA